MTTSETIPAMYESGVRRRVRSFWQRIQPYLLPMAPRKHDEPQQRDKSMMAWRTAVSGSLATIISMLYVINSSLRNSPDGNHIQTSIDRLGTRIEHVESKVDTLAIEIQVVRGVVDGMKRGRGL